MSPLRGADSGDVDVAGEALRAHGLRMTPQRARVMESVRRLAHATPEEIAEHVSADGGPPLSLSTVYRALEALEGVGAVSHGHLQHRAPTYHLASHADHLHLRCTRCGAVDEAEVATAAGLARALAAARGFVADMRHLVIPVLGAGLLLVVLVASSPVALIVGAVWAVLGVVILLLRRPSARTADTLGE